MDKKKVGEFMKQIIGAYPSFRLTTECIQIWGRHMADIDYDLAIKRLDKHIKAAGTGKFAPSISEILNPEESNKRKKWEEPDTLSPAAVMQGGYKLM